MNRIIDWQQTLSVALLTALSLINNGYAEENNYNLPALNSGGALYSAEEPGIDPLEKSLQGKQRAEKYLKQHLDKYTRMKLTDDTTIYLRSRGFKLKTDYVRGNISTELEAKDKGDVTFTLKIKF